MAFCNRFSFDAMVNFLQFFNFEFPGIIISKDYIVIHFLVSTWNTENLVVPTFQNYVVLLSSNFYGLHYYCTYILFKKIFVNFWNVTWLAFFIGHVLVFSSSKYLLPVLHFSKFNCFRKPFHWVWSKFTALLFALRSSTFINNLNYNAYWCI